jgi:uncharacterized membrane protein (DUF485 family)
MAGVSSSLGARPKISLYIEVNEDAVNTTGTYANTSDVGWVVYLRVDAYQPSWSLDQISYWSASVNGVTVANGNSFSFDFRNASAGYTLTLGSGNFRVANSNPVVHNSDGSKVVSFSASVNADVIGAASTGTGNLTLTNISRVPQAPAAPTVTRPTTGYLDSSRITVTSAVASAALGSPTPPAITDYQYQESTTSSTGPWQLTAQSMGVGRTVDLVRNAAQFYWYQTRAVNSEGPGPWSATTTAYVPPVYTTVNIPLIAVPGIAYSGNVSATNTTAYSISAGALPTGISLNTTSGVISGIATVPGPYTFVVTATGPGGTAVTDVQQIFVGGSGPWVKQTNSSPITISTAVVSSNKATITTSSNHGITEFNQPIVISGITGTFAFLNGTWNVLSYTNTQLVFTVNNANVSSGTPAGSPALVIPFVRSKIYVYDATHNFTSTKRQAAMRVYDSTYTDAAGSHWRPIV